MTTAVNEVLQMHCTNPVERIAETLLRQRQRLAETMIVNGASSSAKLVFSRLHGDTPTLEQLVGRMDHNMFAAMEAEHTRAIDSDRQLFTHLGDSTSRIEWRFVMTPDDPPDGGWPLRDVEILQPDGSKLRTRRQPKPLSDFDEVVRGQNDALTAMGRYAVTREEIIMCRLYTSPMFMKYNGVLRNVRGPVAAAALAKLCELCGPPEGATTLEENNRDKNANSSRSMPSLAAMELPTFAYSSANLAAMQPELLL